METGPCFSDVTGERRTARATTIGRWLNRCARHEVHASALWQRLASCQVWMNPREWDGSILPIFWMVRRAKRIFSSRPNPDPPQWATVDVKGMQVERLRRFGDVYLGLALWRRLDLDRFFDDAMKPGCEEIPWSTMACILVLARFCAPSSELQIADLWYGKTALEDLLGVPSEKIYDQRLYRSLGCLAAAERQAVRAFTAHLRPAVRHALRPAALRYHLDVFRRRGCGESSGETGLFTRFAA
jgi:hypothetical protein